MMEFGLPRSLQPSLQKSPAGKDLAQHPTSCVSLFALTRSIFSRTSVGLPKAVPFRVAVLVPQTVP